MKTKTVSFIFIISVLFFGVHSKKTLAENESSAEQESTSTATEEVVDIVEDLILHKQYDQYLKYEKYDNYKDYKKAKEKYGFENSGEKSKCKDHYEKYKQFKKNPARYPQYSIYSKDYKKYKRYREEYIPLQKYSNYGKYKKYDDDDYKEYGTEQHQQGSARYEKYLKDRANIGLGEADLGGGPLGPEVTVGLWNYSRDDLRGNPFKIHANKAYNVKNANGEVIAQVPAETDTRVTYANDGNLAVYGPIAETAAGSVVYFEATDGNNDDMIFDAHRPSSEFDEYRGKMILRYEDTSKLIWSINALPLEYYVWGMGEITGTGDEEYNKVMTTSFRTYGYWKIKYSTKYAKEGFKVNATPGNQLYYGYNWETGHARIKEAALVTQGNIVMYVGKIAITPYSSWTDGKTRSFQERWGSKKYPWCRSVDDSYGKHPSKETAQLENEGNHMVGLSAHGALKLAGENNWNWQEIIRYYYAGVDILKAY